MGMTYADDDPPKPQLYVSNPDTEEYVCAADPPQSPWQRTVHRLVTVLRP
jgi:hypothetical protein